MTIDSQEKHYNLNFEIYRGKEIDKIMDPLAQLRIGVFREYPYLYDGDLAEEQEYLSRYLDIKDSFVLMVFDKGQAIGATTASPLIEEYEDFRIAYEKGSINSKEVFYFGESMLIPAYRGLGLYKIFMRERQNAAKQRGAKMCSFLSVKRPEDHPLKPANYQDLKPIWSRYGFVEHPEIEPWYIWKDIDQPDKTKKTFSVWIKVF
jgi:GNAT superfamily N-acetyltransferase